MSYRTSYIPRKQQGPPLYTPVDASGHIQWPPFAHCVVCKDRRDPTVTDVQRYANCDFMHLKCLHFICSRACLQILIELESGPACPTCKLKFDPDEVTRRTFRPLEMVQAVPRTAERGFQPIVLCTHCLRLEEGVAWCETCAEVLCKNCEDYHPHNKATHNHIVRKGIRTGRITTEAEKLTQTYECQKHALQVLSQFCEDCDVRLCNLCISTDPRHAEHKITTVEQLVKQIKCQMNSNFKDIRAFIDAGTETDRLLRDQVTMCLTAESEYLAREASQYLSIIIATLIEKEKAVRKEISEIPAKKAKMHLFKRAKVNSILLQLANYRNIIEALRNSTDDQILLESTHIISGFEDMKKQFEMSVKDCRRRALVEEGSHFTMDTTVVSKLQSMIKDMGKIVYGHIPGSKMHQRLYAYHSDQIRAADFASATTNSPFYGGTIRSPMAEVGFLRHSPFIMTPPQDDQTSLETLTLQTSLNHLQPITPSALIRPRLTPKEPQQRSKVSQRSSNHKPSYAEYMKLRQPQESTQSNVTSSRVKEQVPGASVDTISPFKVPRVPLKYLKKKSPLGSPNSSGESRNVARKSTSGLASTAPNKSASLNDTEKSNAILSPDVTHKPSTSHSAATDVTSSSKKPTVVTATTTDVTSTSTKPPVVTATTTDTYKSSDALGNSHFYNIQDVQDFTVETLGMEQVECCSANHPEDSSDEPMIVYESLVNVGETESVMDWAKSKGSEGDSSSKDGEGCDELLLNAEEAEEENSEGSGGTDTTELIGSPGEKTPFNSKALLAMWQEEREIAEENVVDIQPAESSVKSTATATAKEDGNAGTKQGETIVDSQMPPTTPNEVTEFFSQFEKEGSPPEAPQPSKLPSTGRKTPRKAQLSTEVRAEYEGLLIPSASATGTKPAGVFKSYRTGTKCPPMLDSSSDSSSVTPKKRPRKKKSIDPEFVRDLRSSGGRSRLRKTRNRASEEFPESKSTPKTKKQQQSKSRSVSRKKKPD